MMNYDNNHFFKMKVVNFYYRREKVRTYTDKSEIRLKYDISGISFSTMLVYVLSPLCSIILKWSESLTSVL